MYINADLLQSMFENQKSEKTLYLKGAITKIM